MEVRAQHIPAEASEAAAPPAQTRSPSPPPASEHAQQESQPSAQQQPAALSARAQKLLNRLEKGGELGSMLRVAAWEKKWRKQVEAMLQAISNLPTAAELEQAKDADIGLLQAVLQHVDDEASRSNALAAMEGLRRSELLPPQALLLSSMPDGTLGSAATPELLEDEELVPYIELSERAVQDAVWRQTSAQDAAVSTCI